MDQQQNSWSAFRAAGRVARRRIIRFVLAKFGALVFPLIAFLAIFVFLFGFVYFAVFMVPRYIAEEVQAKVIYHSGEQDPWTLDQDAALYKQYMDINEEWLSRFKSKESLDSEKVKHISGSGADYNATVGSVWGSITAEQDQVRPHAVPWSVLGGLDRVLGDPIMGLPEREPNPEYHHDYLEPELEWTEFELYYHRRWVECYDNECVTLTETYRHPVMLLQRADAYDAEFEYEWEAEVEERETEDSYLKVITPKVKSVSKTGPYYEDIENLLAEHGLVQKLDTELVLELAVNMDSEFHYEFATLTDYRIGSPVIYDGPTGPITWPAEGTITSQYGMRFHPILKVNKMHTGIDIANAEGTPIRAAANGVVIHVGALTGYGNTIIINHGECTTMYAHLKNYAVKVGDEVSAGDMIGEMGSTGWSTGPHLHFEVRVNGEYVDPLGWLPNL